MTLSLTCNVLLRVNDGLNKCDFNTVYGHFLNFDCNDKDLYMQVTKTEVEGPEAGQKGGLRRS